MKLLSAALLLASIASVRSANTVRIVLSYGVRMIDPTGTAGLLEAPDSIDLVVDGKFAPFERKVKTVDGKGWKDYMVNFAVNGHEMDKEADLGSANTLWSRARSCRQVRQWLWVTIWLRAWRSRLLKTAAM